MNFVESLVAKPHITDSYVVDSVTLDALHAAAASRRHPPPTLPQLFVVVRVVHHLYNLTCLNKGLKAVLLALGSETRLPQFLLARSDGSRHILLTLFLLHVRLRF